MQQPVNPIPCNRYRFPSLTGTGVLLAILASCFALVGCEPPPTPPDEVKPFAGQTLTLRCPEAAFADAIAPMVMAWEVRTGAKVTLAREEMKPTDNTDIGIISTGELGEWGEAGLLASLPIKMRASDHPFQWFGLIPAYGERLVEWGGQTLAVPLTGEGFVLVYRADRFAEQKPPSTWEEFADLAVSFADRDKKPSLPPLPTHPDRMFDLFCRVASSMDRRALSDAEVAGQAARNRDAFAFQFSLVTGKPRLTAFGFERTAEWLNRLQTAKAIPTIPPGGSDDPVAALAEGRAVMAILSLAELARLPRDNGMVSPRFALAGVPGSRTYFNLDTNAPVTAPNSNYVPYFSGGRLGVVRSHCTHTEAAFDLLAELGGPARSAELVATPGLGAGPMRSAHLERERMLLWLGYGFDEQRSKLLQDTMRHYISPSVKNPTYGLRGPDRKALVGAANDPLRKIGAGLTPDAALNQAEAAWKALDAKVPEPMLLRWRQRAAGLN